MITNLRVYNFDKTFKIDPLLRQKANLSGAFILSTCQRKLIVSTDFIEPIFLQDADLFEGKDAYRFLLEVICGLQSQMIAENEIVAQFKQALQEYLQVKNRRSTLIKVIEKLLKDSKLIRTKYLKEISQKTYSGIVRKTFQKHHKEKPLLIIGSGNLCLDIINQMKKKCEIFISARNPDRVKELCNEHNIGSIDWKDYRRYESFDHIANTIGAETILFDHQFFHGWNRPQSVFIDLGSPSTVKTSLNKDDGVYFLSNILDQGAIREKEKTTKINLAKKAICDIVDVRVEDFKKRKQSWQKNTKLAPGVVYSQ